MAIDTPSIAIMFADLSGSTRLYELLGDVTARNKVMECLDTIAAVVTQRHGMIIKTIGDELMGTFPSAEDAVMAACEVNEAFEDVTIETASAEPFALSVRVGLHYGPAIEENGDVFGDAVNIAARMAAMAKAGQIITTEPTVDMLSPTLRARTRFIDRAPVKGKKDTIDIFEVIWQEDDATGMASDVITGVISNQNTNVSMYLRYRGRELVLDDAHPSAVLGRSKTCDVSIDDKLASRQHVKIECRRGKFFIIDQSTNGTYFRMDHGEESFLRREEMPLTGRGQISLGRSVGDRSRKPVDFEIEP